MSSMAFQWCNESINEYNNGSNEYEVVHDFDSQLDTLTMLFSTVSIGKKKGYKKAAEIAKRRERELQEKQQKEKGISVRDQRAAILQVKRSTAPIMKKRQRKEISSTSCSSRSDYSMDSYELDMDAILEKLGAISFSHEDI
jgi:hypothetical protein